MSRWKQNDLLTELENFMVHLRGFNHLNIHLLSLSFHGCIRKLGGCQVPVAYFQLIGNMVAP